MAWDHYLVVPIVTPTGRKRTKSSFSSLSVYCLENATRDSVDVYTYLFTHFSGLLNIKLYIPQTLLVRGKAQTV